MTSRSQSVLRASLQTVSLVLLLSALTLQAVGQQTIGIPTIPETQELLDEGLREFEMGRYDSARSLFDQIQTEFSVNASSSAARLMSAKSAFRMGDYSSTRATLAGFASDFPTSRYLESARNLDEIALVALRSATSEAINLGVLLSLSDEDRVASQELFNGIRLSVDEHNAQVGNQKIRMIYRDVGDGPAAARSGVRQLAALGAQLIIGTLYSEEAIAAAEQAERDRVVFLAPLATDEEVSRGRRYAFQANASMTSRGEAMARFAVNGLRLDSLGVISSSDDRRVGERLSDGFVQVASELGAKINFISILPDESFWYQLSDLMPTDTLQYVQAIYVPLATRDPVTLAGAVLSAFERTGRTPRLLGNAAWHDLPQKTNAAHFTTTYANDYFVDEEDPQYEAFKNEFEILSGKSVNRLGVTGYDVTSFALRALSRGDSRQLYDVIRHMPPYEGLGLRIHFDGGNVNQYFFFHRYRDNSLTLIR